MYITNFTDSFCFLFQKINIHFFGHPPASYTLYYIITEQCSQWSSFKTTAS
ncbi:hypothetical protein BACCOP_03613 [Phocaeicola coprocola DSM 17136]|uniref:Uncharacterized protein n=1 Tax=Phocaeicola coprocola DSM 17136 TaxID=470145 RepID=B3JNU7_9BACT|nr:hypothetical protein BACCOP_03613 [Phocaeicola coprocola DSM 17136]